MWAWSGEDAGSRWQRWSRAQSRDCHEKTAASLLSTVKKFLGHGNEYGPQESITCEFKLARGSCILFQELSSSATSTNNSGCTEFINLRCDATPTASRPSAWDMLTESTAPKSDKQYTCEQVSVSTILRHPACVGVLQKWEHCRLIKLQALISPYCNLAVNI